MFEETLQVRVRRKNPLIERKVTEAPAEGATLADLSELAGAVVARATVPVAPKTPLYESPESSDTTQRFEIGDPRAKKKAAPAERVAKARRAEPPELPRRAAELLDEDLTEVADAPPGGPVVPEPHVRSDVPTERPQPSPRTTNPRTVHRVRDHADPAQHHAREQKREPVLPPEVVPRELLGKWGTDAVNAAAQRATIARRDEALPEVHSPLLKSLRGELSKDELFALDRCLAGELDEQRTEPSLSPKRSLEHLINEHAYNDLNAVERAKVLRAIARDPRDIATIKSAIAVLKTGVARRLRSEDREKLFETFVALDSETRALFARTAARALRGRSALEDRDFEDSSLVAHLFRLTREEPLAADAERLGMRRNRVLLLLLGSLANPERLPFEEGGDGVLGMFEYALADSSPAELARLWVDLVTEEMATALPGDARLDLGERVRGDARIAFSSRETPLRLGLEMLVELAHPRARADRSGFIMPGGHGVDADVISRALSLIYGVGFTVAAGAPTAMRHLERVPKDHQRVPPVFVTLLYERGERLFLFDHFDQEGVVLRAPHGRSTKRRGNERADPARTVEDPDLGQDRVSLDTLKSLIGVALVPRT